MDPNDELDFINDLENLDIEENTTSSDADNVSIDEVLSMSEEEINALLDEKKNGAGSSDSRFYADASLNDLLASDSMKDDGNLHQIENLLHKEKEQIPVDKSIENMLNNLSNEKLEFENYDASDLFFDESKEKKKGKKKEKTKKKKVQRSAKSGNSGGLLGGLKELLSKKKDSNKKKETKEKTKKNVKNTENPTSKNDNLELTGDESTELTYESLPEEVDLLEEAQFESQISEDSVVQELDAAELDSILEVRDSSDEAAEVIETLNPAEGESKKKGLIQKIKDLLSEPDEEEEEQEAEKKPKKEKKKKGKGKDKDKGKEEAEDGEEEAAPDKKKKEKKPKKPKIKKAAPPDNSKKFPVKRMLPILLVFLLIAIAFVTVVTLYMGYNNKKQGVAAYERGDYLECYKTLYGQNLTESQEIMFHKSEINLKMELIKNNYKEYKAQGRLVNALDHLIQFFCGYQKTREEAEKWNCGDVVVTTHDEMVDVMYQDYGISEEKAIEFGNIEDDYDYTRALMDYVSQLEEEKEK